MKRAVVDQPGLKIIFFGLLVAGFVGLIVRSQITNQKVNLYVQNFFQDLEKKNDYKKINIAFSDAHLMLADWGFPFPHLVINKIKIAAAVPECADNQIYIESLDVPLSWKFLFRFKKNLDAVRASTVELRLSNPEACFGTHKKNNETNAPSVSTIIDRHRDVASIQSLSDLQTEFSVFIEKLRIIDKHNYNVPILMQTLNSKIFLDQNKLVAVEVHAQLYLFKDIEQSIYKLKSDLSFNFNRKQEATEANLNLRGKLIDKSFEVNLVLDKNRNKILIDHKMTDLSLKALLSLFSKNSTIDIFQKQFEGISGLVFTSAGSGEFDLNYRQFDFYKIEKIILASGDSRAEASPFEIKSFKPLIFSSFGIDIQQFDLEKLKNISALLPVQKSVSDFGKISGRVKVNSLTDFEAAGQVEGIKLIFSNRGQRANQTIDQFKYKLKQQKLNLDDITLEGQKVIGQVEIDLPATSSNGFKFKANVSNVKLNESVYTIFSFNQTKPTLIDLSFNDDGQQVHAKIKFDQLVSSYAEINQSEVNYAAQISADEKKMINPSYEILIKDLKLIPSEEVDKSFYEVLKKIDAAQSENSDKELSYFNFEAVRASHKSTKDDETEIKISSSYLGALKGDKRAVNIKSVFKNSQQTLFKVDVTNRGKSLNKFDFAADLNKFYFEIK